MDVFAHTLWTAAVYQKIPWRRRLLAAGFGVAPDLVSFGPFFVYHFFTGTRFAGPPELASIPAYVFSAYNLTHSLVVWAVVTLLVFLFRRRLPWVMGGWLLHILIDIVTHNEAFFPTPFLWPISNYHVNGVSWAEPWFMEINYAALIVVYVVWYVRLRSKRKVSEITLK